MLNVPYRIMLDNFCSKIYGKNTKKKEDKKMECNLYLNAMKIELEIMFIIIIL